MRRWRARRARIEDPRDWSPVALALALDGGSWAEDRHFCGIGVPVWSTRVLLAHLALPRAARGRLARSPASRTRPIPRREHPSRAPGWQATCDGVLQ
jgi:hypothetical protein